jgi:catalase
MKDHDQKEQPAMLGEDRKFRQLDTYRNDPDGTHLTSDQGLRVDDTTNSLKAGIRGPSLIEDFHLREKITHFDHERIPERVVHARGSGAHGYFQVYEDLSELTMARFLHEPAERTPVFVRFSTVLGSRGSADTVRDVRGFAVKFYTKEGNFDLVGNNIPEHPCLLHPGRHPVPGRDPRGQARAPPRDPRGLDGPRHLLGLHLADPREHAHDHVGALGPGHPPQLPHDAGLRRAHLPPGQRRR